LFFLQSKEGIPVRKTKLSLDEAVEFVRETVGTEPEAWEVHIAETQDEKYGGNISVDKEGRAIFEMTVQGQGGVSAGTVTPEMRAWQDYRTGIWKYNTDDSKLRQLIQGIMKDVPHDGRDFLPGLYEFHLVQEADGPVETKFIDYNPLR
jgi:hypothetical protein